MRTNGKDGGSSSSIWLDAAIPERDTPPEHETDVVVIGAGIAGLTTAFELARRGVRLTVLDDGPIGGGETGRTSAHLCSAVDEDFYDLEQKFGRGGAQIVAESHSVAVDYIEAMCRARRIDCDFRRVDGYLIKPPGHERGDNRELERELAAAQRAGLECEMVDEAPLPFDTGPALRYARQAEFHPLKYLRGLADGVMEMGAKIHTAVRVERSVWSPWRKASAVIGIGGAAAIGAGVFFQLRSADQQEDADARCPLVVCNDPVALELNDDARTNARRSNMFYIGGAVAVGSAVALWFIGGPTETTVVSPVIGSDHAGAALSGSF